MLKSLDGSEQRLVVGQLTKLKTSPLLGKPLGHRRGIDLTGYRKVYAANKRLRIIYQVREAEVLVEVIAIGPRADMRVYQIAAGEVSGSGRRRLRRLP
jgi:mRNA-degrading endonuclease RelE of RelBE toxin-antitoxin system